MGSPARTQLCMGSRPWPAAGSPMCLAGRRPPAHRHRKGAGVADQRAAPRLGGERQASGCSLAVEAKEPGAGPPTCAIAWCVPLGGDGYRCISTARAPIAPVCARAVPTKSGKGGHSQPASQHATEMTGEGRVRPIPWARDAGRFHPGCRGASPGPAWHFTQSLGTRLRGDKSMRGDQTLAFVKEPPLWFSEES